MWWYEHKHIYPKLYCMALNYYAISDKSSVFFILIPSYGFFKPHLLQLNVFLARAGWFCSMSITDSWLNLHELCYALETGASTIL